MDNTMLDVRIGNRKRMVMVMGKTRHECGKRERKKKIEQQNKSRGKKIMNKNRKCVLPVSTWEYVFLSIVGLLCFYSVSTTY